MPTPVPTGGQRDRIASSTLTHNHNLNNNNGTSSTITATMQRAVAPSFPPPSSSVSVSGASAEAEEEDENHQSTSSPAVGMLSRKEKRKAVVQQRLERQLDRLSAIHARQQQHQQQLDDAEAQQAEGRDEAKTATETGDGNSEEAVLEGAGASSSSAGRGGPTTPAPRHDPKFIHGTFWRDRKEKKKRTLFVGNLPAAYPKDAVRSTLEAVVAAAAEHTNQEILNIGAPMGADGTPSSVVGPPFVTEVDLLPARRGQTLVSGYVTFSTYAVSQFAQSILNGLPLEGKALRANAADDKNQRAEAIRRREGSTHLRGGVQPLRMMMRGGGGFGGRGFGGGGRGFVGRGRGGAPYATNTHTWSNNRN